MSKQVKQKGFERKDEKVYPDLLENYIHTVYHIKTFLVDYIIEIYSVRRFRNLYNVAEPLDTTANYSHLKLECTLMYFLVGKSLLKIFFSPLIQLFINT